MTLTLKALAVALAAVTQLLRVWPAEGFPSKGEIAAVVVTVVSLTILWG